jgi:putative transposase
MAGRGMGKWNHRNEEQVRSLLSRHSDSGLSVEAFCEREAVSTASFYRWRRLLQRQEGAERSVAVRSEPAFIDLGALRGGPAPAAPVELRLDLGGGLTLHLVRR